MQRSLSSVAVFAVLALSIACSGAQEPDPRSYSEAAAYEYSRGVQRMENKRHDEARVFFARVQQRYPYSEYAALSELRSADSYFAEKSYIRAIDAYRRFVRLHPTHPDVEYAEYRIVKSYVERMPGDVFVMPPSYERDLTDALFAQQASESFLGRYPEGEFSERARELRLTVIDRLASSELYVARFYHRRDNHLAVARRCAYLLDNFPDSTPAREALWMQVRALDSLGERDAARAAFARLQEAFPGSDEAQRASVLLGPAEDRGEEGGAADDGADGDAEPTGAPHAVEEGR